MADCIDEIITAEGEGSNDADDSGGLTRWGISQVAHPEVDVEHLTREGARHIYEHTYLTASRICTIDPPYLREQLLDFAVNAGIAKAIKTLQFILRIHQDAVIGPQTRAALAARDPKVVNNMLVGARESFYYALAEARPKDKKYLKGWIKRARKFLIT